MTIRSDRALWICCSVLSGIVFMVNIQSFIFHQKLCIFTHRWL